MSSQDRWFPVPYDIGRDADATGAASREKFRALTRSLLTSANNTIIKYEPFSTTRPLFADPRDERLFWENPENRIQVEVPSPEQLIGRIKILNDHLIHSSQNCGWQTNETFLSYRLPYPSMKIRRRVEFVCPLLVPQSNSFQHFVDGVLPKLMQVFHIVNNTQVQLMIYRSWDRSIEQMLAKLGVGSNRITYYDSGYYHGQYVLDTCNTPPLHPSLWDLARKHLGMEPHRQVRNRDGYVVYISRTWSRNYGRNTKNEEEVVDFLQRRYSYTFQFFQKPMDLKETMDLFRNTRILIGVHGGALYNVIFCPQDTEIVEIMPTNVSGSVVPDSLAHTIIWKMSSMLRQTYWRLSETPLNKLGDVNIDISKLTKVLNVIDKTHGL